MAEKKVLKMEEIKVGIEKSIKAIAIACKSGKTDDAIKAETNLKSLEKQYVEQRTKEVFGELCKTKTPIIEAIKMYSFEVPTHRVTTNDDGVMTGIETGKKNLQIDLLKFCQYGDFDAEWEHTASKFNLLLCLRAAREIGYTPKEIESLASKYYLSQQAKAIELGKTPDSNNQLCKALQAVIDEIVFVPKVVDGKEVDENSYKCNNHDVAYLLALYTKKGKEKLSVAVAKDNFLRRILMDVLNRIITTSRDTATGFKPAKEEKKEETKA